VGHAERRKFGGVAEWGSPKDLKGSKRKLRGSWKDEERPTGASDPAKYTHLDPQKRRLDIGRRRREKREAPFVV